jgi:DNA-binding transcriptional MerR regulator
MKERSNNNHDDSRLYYSISEAATMTQVRPHVLRYWESQFKMLHPRKNKAGNRMYKKRDLKLVMLIKDLLYEKGYTIAGAQKMLSDDKDAVRDQLEMRFDTVDRAARLLEVQRELRTLLRDVKGTLDTP